MSELMHEEKKPLTEDQRNQRDILAALEKLGANRVTDDSLVFEGRKFILPETMDIDGAIRFLGNWKEANEEVTGFSRIFKYSPWDGAAAVSRALKRVFGMAGIGRATFSFFGKNPPEMRTVPAGPRGKTIQVPWGVLKLDALENTELYLMGGRDEELGAVFQISVETPKKYKAHIEGLFDVIQQELEENSIYAGQAWDDKQMPDFIDTEAVDENKVVYSEDVLAQLQANLWALLEHTELMEGLGIPMKRAVLFEGPYGTGKTLAGELTAKKAVENGWTFVYKRAGANTDIREVMAKARMYQPAVLYIEDVDTIASGDTTDRDRVAELLDIFDGIKAKNTKLIVVMTTNHVERIHKGMVRPGRLDAVIHVGALDRKGVEKLTRSVMPEDLIADGVNFDAVYDAMDGFMPAFVREAVDRALRYAVARTGDANVKLDTADFVNAAHGLRPQLELMEGAGEGVGKDPLAMSLERVFADALNKVEVTDHDDPDSKYYRLLSNHNE